MTATSNMIGHNAMTEADYDAERALIDDRKKEADVRWQQELAKLLYRSGWTQERLAEKEGRARTWVTQNVKFGQFLEFVTVVTNPKIGPAVTERAFRDCWAKTDGNDRERFQQAAKLLAERTAERTEVLIRSKQRSPQVSQKILDDFADGKWHRPEEIAEALNIDAEDATLAIESLGNRNRAKVVKHPIGKTGDYGPGHTYRIFPKEEGVSFVELKEKLGPIVKALKELGRRPVGTISNTGVLDQAGALQRLLSEWGELETTRPAPGKRSPKTNGAQKDYVNV